MKKKIFLSIILMLVFFSCDNSGNCSVSLQLAKEQSCNIIVTDNINKSSSWAIAGLNFKGIDLTNGEEVLYKSNAREWNPLSDYINVGDTVVKNEGEAVIYVYKKDSIVIRNLNNICNADFDWKKDVYTFILRDSIGR